MSWLTREGRARRAARCFERETAALQREVLLPDEQQILLPLCMAQLQALERRLRGVEVEGASQDVVDELATQVARLRSAPVASVPGLRAFFAQLSLVTARLRHGVDVPADERRDLEAIAVACDGLIMSWRDSYASQIADMSRYATARLQASATRLYVLLAVAASLVPFAIANCFDAYRAMLESEDPGGDCEESGGPDPHPIKAIRGTGAPGSRLRVDLAPRVLEMTVHAPPATRATPRPRG